LKDFDPKDDLLKGALYCTACVNCITYCICNCSPAIETAEDTLKLLSFAEEYVLEDYLYFLD
jgi:hypothetical protein